MIYVGHIGGAPFICRFPVAALFVKVSEVEKHSVVDGGCSLSDCTDLRYENQLVHIVAAVTAIHAAV